MRDEGLKVLVLPCFTPTLPLIAALQLHNSYNVTDQPQTVSQQSQLMKQGGGNNLSNTDTGTTSFI